ncbi:SDR family NAD(P)-dependent oxidoreductase [bacterium]|nr:SDR family NAD(P)-dependent oxidoreductase [bacterium]
MKTVNVDLIGFLAMADIAVKHFEQQGHGHLVGISSVSGLKGEAVSPIYSGANAFISRYLEGMRNRMHQNKVYDIYFTDIIPGYVEIEDDDVHQIPGVYWIATKERAGRDIYEAIKKKKKRAFITKRWQLIAWAYAICPDWLYNKLGGF